MKVSEAAKWFDSDSGVVVLNLDTGRYFGLNQVAGLIWVQLSSGGSIDSISAAIVTRYEVTREDASRDIDVCLRSLEDAGLVV